MKPKRKLTDLKPDEVVYVKSKKQAEYINTIIGLPFKCVSPCFIQKENEGFSWSSQSSHNGLATAAKHFLPSKKSTRKMVKELECRLEAMEKLNSIPVEYFEQPFVLPEKWCVRRNEENHKIINDWANSFYKGVIYFNYDELYFYLVENGVNTFETLVKGYTEITTEQFIKHVLKREAVPVTVNQVEPNDAGSKTDLSQNDEPSKGQVPNEQPKEIDFSVAGQLVENENGYVILTSGRHTEEMFSGTQLNTLGYKYIGYKSKSFDKTDFKLSNKEITLSNK